MALPRFELRATVPLRDALEALGVKTAFRDTADFGGIAAERLELDAVLHEGYLRVDEHGTEAAVVAKAAAARLASYVFRADRPFLYVIRDNATGAILFIGRVVKPAPIGA